MLNDDQNAAIQSLRRRYEQDGIQLSGQVKVSPSGNAQFGVRGGGSIGGDNLQVEAASLVDGLHYTEVMPQIRDRKRAGELDQALALTLKCVAACERESDTYRRVKGSKWAMAPAYTTEAAIIYRKQGRLDEEVAILERYMAHAANPRRGTVADRLVKAKALRDKKAAH